MINQRSLSWQIQRLFGSKFFLLLNLLVLVFLIFSFGREFARNHAIRKEIAEMEAVAVSLQTQNSDIASLLEAIQTESFVEHEARVKLGMIKPGEKTVIIENKNTNIGSNLENNEIENYEAVDSFSTAQVAKPLKWWYYFFDPIKFRLLNYPYDY